MLLLFYLFFIPSIVFLVKGIKAKKNGDPARNFFILCVIFFIISGIIAPAATSKKETDEQQQEVVEQSVQETEQEPVVEQKEEVTERTIVAEEVEPEVTEEPKTEKSYSWIINTETMKVHTERCRHVDESKSNFKESDLSPDELKAKGYSACGTCKPFK